MSDILKLHSYVNKLDRVETKHALQALRVQYAPRQKTEMLKQLLMSRISSLIASGTDKHTTLDKVQAVTKSVRWAAVVPGMAYLLHYASLSAVAPVVNELIKYYQSTFGLIPDGLKKALGAPAMVLQLMAGRGQACLSIFKKLVSRDAWKGMTEAAAKISKDKQFVGSLKHFNTVVAILIAAYGITWVAEGFGEAFSMHKKDAMELLGKITSHNPRVPAAATYAKLKNACNPLPQTKCVVTNECKWNATKSKCSVNSDLKYMYKPVKPTAKGDA